MFVVYTKDKFDLAYLSDEVTELSPEIETLLKNLYGENTVFESYNETIMSYEEFSALRDNGDLLDFGVKLVDNIPKFVITKKISITSDKMQIIADGVDIATITATIDDLTSTEIINFYVNGTLVSSENAVGGVETIQINATQTGTIMIEAESTTKYGRNSITIEVVSV